MHEHGAATTHARGVVLYRRMRLLANDSNIQLQTDCDKMAITEVIPVRVPSMAKRTKITIYMYSIVTLPIYHAAVTFQMKCI